MAKLLYDLMTTQPTRSSRFHGGGAYGQRYLLDVLEHPVWKERGIALVVARNPDAFLPDEIADALKDTGVATIDVRDLFYNAPVRKSFLKTERQEYQAIELVIKQFALSAMTVAFSLKHNGKETLHLPAAHDERTRLQRIKKLFGQAFLADAIYIDEVHEHLSIQGWITQSNYQRSQRDRQWIYLNQRLIKDKLMHQAIGQSYQELLHPGRHAACVLYVSIAPDQVDVNVHPTKHEVRFRQPRLVHTMMVSILTQNVHPPSPVELTTPKSQTNEPSTRFGKTPTSPSADMPWIPINAQFVILKSAHAETYLLDLQRAHQYYLATLICDTTQPLPCRSLLVPIRVEIARSAFTAFERYQTELQALGIQFDFMNEVSLLIRTIPLCLPLLDLEQFFVSIQQAYCDKKTLIERAIACQSFDVYNMRPIEIETLWAYCSQHWSELQQRNVGMLLDAERCRKITKETRSHDNNTLVLSDGPDSLG